MPDTYVKGGDRVTEKELKQLFYLNRETERLIKDLKELEYRDGYHSPILTGMPKSSRRKDISDYAAEMADLKEIINANLYRIQQERARLERYIDTIDDAEIRLIMRLRHINGMSWVDIAAEMMVLDDNGRVVRDVHRTTLKRKYKKFLDAHNAHSNHVSS